MRKNTRWAIFLITLLFLSDVVLAQSPVIVPAMNSERFHLVLTILGQNPQIQKLDIEFSELKECEQAGYKWQRDSEKASVLNRSRFEFSFTCLRSNKAN